MTLFVERVLNAVQQDGTMEQLPSCFLQVWYGCMGCPKSIVPDRDPKFTSVFCGELFRLTVAALKAISAAQRSMPQKLRTLYKGPLEAIEVIDPLAYRLRLPKGSRAHDVFPLVYLLPYKPPGTPCNATGQDPSRPRPKTTPGALYTEDGEDYWEVEAIVGERAAADGSMEYLVRWKGFTAAHDSFEPQAEVQHLRAYKQYIRSKQLAAKQQQQPKQRAGSKRSVQRGRSTV
jgi:Chromo (CHRromatin Organisation MOdifier) domain